MLERLGFLSEAFCNSLKFKGCTAANAGRSLAELALGAYPVSPVSTRMNRAGSFQSPHRFHHQYRQCAQQSVPERSERPLPDARPRPVRSRRPVAFASRAGRTHRAAAARVDGGCRLFVERIALPQRISRQHRFLRGTDGARERYPECPAGPQCVPDRLRSVSAAAVAHRPLRYRTGLGDGARFRSRAATPGRTAERVCARGAAQGDGGRAGHCGIRAVFRRSIQRTWKSNCRCFRIRMRCGSCANSSCWLASAAMLTSFRPPKVLRSYPAVRDRFRMSIISPAKSPRPTTRSGSVSCRCAISPCAAASAPGFCRRRWSRSGLRSRNPRIPTRISSIRCGITRRPARPRRSFSPLGATRTSVPRNPGHVSAWRPRE